MFTLSTIMCICHSQSYTLESQTYALRTQTNALLSNFLENLIINPATGRANAWRFFRQAELDLVNFEL